MAAPTPDPAADPPPSRRGSPAPILLAVLAVVLLLILVPPLLGWEAGPLWAILRAVGALLRLFGELR